MASRRASSAELTNLDAPPGTPAAQEPGQQLGRDSDKVEQAPDDHGPVHAVPGADKGKASGRSHDSPLQRPLSGHHGLVDVPGRAKN